MIETFESDGPNQSSEIADALRTGDAVALKAAAHTLNGAAANLGAAHAARLSARLEALASANDLKAAPRLAEELARAVRRAPALLRDELDR